MYGKSVMTIKNSTTFPDDFTPFNRAMKVMMELKSKHKQRCHCNDPRASTPSVIPNTSWLKLEKNIIDIVLNTFSSDPQNRFQPYTARIKYLFGTIMFLQILCGI